MSEGSLATAAPILVPVDFSSHSEHALAWAAELAHKLPAPLVLLHVVHDPADAPGYYLEAQGGGNPERDQPLRSVEDAAGIMMARFLERARKRVPILFEVPIRSELVVGVPTQQILDVASDLGARLIVMGSQGRTGLPRLLLGSKAEHVVRLSPVPVTIVKKAAE